MRSKSDMPNQADANTCSVKRSCPDDSTGLASSSGMLETTFRYQLRATCDVCDVCDVVTGQAWPSHSQLARGNDRYLEASFRPRLVDARKSLARLTEAMPCKKKTSKLVTSYKYHAMELCTILGCHSMENSKYRR